MTPAFLRCRSRCTLLTCSPAHLVPNLHLSLLSPLSTSLTSQSDFQTVALHTDTPIFGTIYRYQMMNLQRCYYTKPSKPSKPHLQPYISPENRRYFALTSPCPLLQCPKPSLSCMSEHASLSLRFQRHWPFKFLLLLIANLGITKRANVPVGRSKTPNASSTLIEAPLRYRITYKTFLLPAAPVSHTEFVCYAINRFRTHFTKSVSPSSQLQHAGR